MATLADEIRLRCGAGLSPAWLLLVWLATHGCGSSATCPVRGPQPPTHGEIGAGELTLRNAELRLRVTAPEHAYYERCSPRHLRRLVDGAWRPVCDQRKPYADYFLDGTYIALNEGCDMVECVPADDMFVGAALEYLQTGTRTNAAGSDVPDLVSRPLRGPIKILAWLSNDPECQSPRLYEFELAR